MHTFVFWFLVQCGWRGHVYIDRLQNLLHLYSEKDIVVLMSLPEASVYQNC